MENLNSHKLNVNAISATAPTFLIRKTWAFIFDLQLIFSTEFRSAFRDLSNI